MTVENPIAEHPFDLDTRVSLTDTAGRFQASLSGRWKALGGVVNGGYSAAVSLRALREVLPHPDPLAVSTFFLRRGKPGPVEIQTEVINHSHNVSTGQAKVIAEGNEIVRTTASFTDLGAAHQANQVTEFSSMPELPAPGECFDPLADVSMPEVTMTEQIEFRYPTRPGWLTGRPTGDPRAEFWIRFTGGRQPDTLSLPLLVDGAAPVVLELGVAGSATMELTTHVRQRPASGWLACRVTTTHVAGRYHEEDFELWDTHGSLVAQSRQLAAVLPPPEAATS